MNITGARYSGSSRKLVVALDIGTMFSGAAYALLDPAEVPQIQSVTRYLNNPDPVESKVPSILYYDRNGNFRGVENGVDFQDDDAFLRMRWWKLMMSPTELPAAMKDQMSTQLPKGKTIVDVFADFMRYLFDSTKALFKASEPDGELRWGAVSNNIELVLTHPYGWGGAQQVQLRTAAVRAGIDPPTGRSRVHFVTESEANFHFCATQTHAGKDLKPGEQVLIIDAGDATIDISTYKVLGSRPLQVEELCEPKRLIQGGDLVTMRATEAVRGMLGDSRFNTPENLEAFSRGFDRGVKKIFSNNQAAQAGRLTLTGTQVSGFFEPPIQSTVDSIRDNLKRHLVYTPGSFAFLIGSFSVNPWFSGQLEKRLLGIGLRFCKPDMQTNNAVSIGAVSCYVGHFVSGRISRFTYGVLGDVLYNPSNPEHVRRGHKVFIDPMGKKRVPGYFIAMLARGTKILEDREIRHRSYLASEDVPPKHVSLQVVKYMGSLVAPEWQDVEKDKFESLCCIKADLSAARYTYRYSATGKMCYKREYDVIFLVSLAELKARVSCGDTSGMRRRTPGVVVVYDGPSERTVGNVGK